MWRLLPNSLNCVHDRETVMLSNAARLSNPSFNSYFFLPNFLLWVLPPATVGSSCANCHDQFGPWADGRTFFCGDAPVLAMTKIAWALATTKFVSCAQCRMKNRQFWISQPCAARRFLYIGDWEWNTLTHLMETSGLPYRSSSSLKPIPCIFHHSGLNILTCGSCKLKETSRSTALRRNWPVSPKCSRCYPAILYWKSVTFWQSHQTSTRTMHWLDKCHPSLRVPMWEPAATAAHLWWGAWRSASCSAAMPYTESTWRGSGKFWWESFKITFLTAASFFGRAAPCKHLQS